MQVFVLDPSPHTSAIKFCAKDFKRFNKQILEMAQLLAISFPELSLKRKDGKLYSSQHHKSHPCVGWVKAHPGWSIEYMKAHLQQFEKVKSIQHGCSSILPNLPHLPIENPEFHFFSKVDVGGGSVFEKYDRLLDLKNSPLVIDLAS